MALPPTFDRTPTPPFLGGTLHPPEHSSLYDRQAAHCGLDGIPPDFYQQFVHTWSQGSIRGCLPVWAAGTSPTVRRKLGVQKE